MVSHVHNFQAFHINTCKLGKTVTLVHDINLKKMHTQGRVCISLLFANIAKKEKKSQNWNSNFRFHFHCQWISCTRCDGQATMDNNRSIIEKSRPIVFIVIEAAAQRRMQSNRLISLTMWLIYIYTHTMIDILKAFQLHLPLNHRYWHIYWRCNIALASMC